MLFEDMTDNVIQTLTMNIYRSQQFSLGLTGAKKKAFFSPLSVIQQWGPSTNSKSYDNLKSTGAIVLI